MFDQLHTYAGTIASDIQIAADGSPSDYAEANAGLAVDSQAEAARMLAEVQGKVDELFEQARIEAEAKAEEIIAQRVNGAVVEFTEGLWSCRSAMADITQTALTRMVGRIGKGEACFGAIEVATREYLDQKTVTVRVASDSIDRLKLAMMSRSSADKLPGNIVVREDASLQDGRCVLDTGDHSFEIGVEAQIAAYTNAVKTALKNPHGQDADQAEGSL